MNLKLIAKYIIIFVSHLALTSCHSNTGQNTNSISSVQKTAPTDALNPTQPIQLTLSTDVKNGLSTMSGLQPYTGTLTKPFILYVKDTNGNPISGAVITASLNDKKGTVFLSHSKTDSRGQTQVSVIPGDNQSQIINLLASYQGVTQTTSVSFQARPYSFIPTDGSDQFSQGSTSVWANFDPPSGFSGDSYRVTLIPKADPDGTFYCGGNSNDGGMYFGFQKCIGNCGSENYNKNIIFSVWNNETQNASVIDAGHFHCIQFGGEGTGWSCTQPFEWQVNKTYQFQVKWVVGTHFIDYTLFLNDLSGTNPVEHNLGTLRFPGKSTGPGGFGTFVEDFARTTDECVDKPVRAMNVTEVSYSQNGVWAPVNSAVADFASNPDRTTGCALAYSGTSRIKGWDLISGDIERETNPFSQKPFGTGDLIIFPK